VVAVNVVYTEVLFGLSTYMMNIECGFLTTRCNAPETEEVARELERVSRRKAL